MAGARAAAVSQRTHQADRALCPGRGAGHDRAPARTEAAGSSRPDGGGGEPRRRQRQHRGRRDHCRAAGRLYAPRRRHHAALRQPAVRQPAVLRSAEGFRADRGAGAHAAVSCGERGHDDQDAPGVHRSCQGASRPAQLRLGGDRQHASSDHGGDEVGAASRHHSHTLSGTSQAVPALLGNHVQVLWASYPNLKAGVEGGRIRLLANNGLAARRCCPSFRRWPISLRASTWSA